MGMVSRLMQAGMAGFNAGWNTGIYTARRVFEDPASAKQEESFMQQSAEYTLLWAYYNNSMFEATARFLNIWTGSWQNNRYNPARNGWSLYKKNYNLYRNIRLIYNPVRRLVDFYAGVVYPGVLSEDGSMLPDGVPLAIPFSEDTPPELKSAVAQFWQWSNWQSNKSVLVRYGSALGSVLVEIIDDVAHGKVCAEVIWPGFVRDLQLDAAGNVKYYSIQYSVWNQDNGSYIYRKDVDQNSIHYYKDDEPYDYDGNGAVVENFYGFCPAVWIKHVNIGGNHGSPAMAGSFGKIDELNNLASHVHDQIHKVIGSPAVMWADGSIKNMFGNPSRGDTNDFERPAQEQENVLILKGPSGGRVEPLVGDLDLAATAVHMDRLIGEIEKDHPELTYYEQLRSMSQITGPAAQRLIGDVAARVAEVNANYDMSMLSLFRMVVAIGGERANSGAWGTLNRQQQKFTPFDLQSYQRGDLDMAIMPRSLITPTKQEIAQEKQAMWTGVGLAVTAGAPLEFVLRDEGFTDEELMELGEAKVQQIQRDQMLASEDVTPDVEQ